MPQAIRFAHSKLPVAWHAKFYCLLPAASPVRFVCVLNRKRFRRSRAGTSNRLFLLFACAYAILAVELLDTAACGDCLLLTRIERMALGADFYVNFLLGGTGHEFVSAVAGYLCLIVFRLNSFLHVIHLAILFVLPGQIPDIL